MMKINYEHGWLDGGLFYISLEWESFTLRDNNTVRGVYPDGHLGTLSAALMNSTLQWDDGRIYIDVEELKE